MTARVSSTSPRWIESIARSIRIRPTGADWDDARGMLAVGCEPVPIGGTGNVAVSVRTLVVLGALRLCVRPRGQQARVEAPPAGAPRQWVEPARTTVRCRRTSRGPHATCPTTSPWRRREAPGRLPRDVARRCGVEARTNATRAQRSARRRSSARASTSPRLLRHRVRRHRRALSRTLSSAK